MAALKSLASNGAMCDFSDIVSGWSWAMPVNSGCLKRAGAHFHSFQPTAVEQVAPSNRLRTLTSKLQIMRVPR